MDFIPDFTQEFMAPFQAGGETFVGWVTGITPMVVCLMTAISSIVKLAGGKRIGNFTKELTKFTIARCTLVPVLVILFLGNPMRYTFRRFVEEKYKPTYCDSYISFLHPITGLFPHVGPDELFVYIGITAGITKLNLPLRDLTVRYFIIGVIVILVRGILTGEIYLRPTSKFTKEKENAEGQTIYREVKTTKGSSGWGEPLVLEPNETCNKVLCVTSGGIHSVAAKTAEMTGAETVDGFKATVPDGQVLVTAVDCEGTARYGIYPKKRIDAVNLVPVRTVEPLAQYITKGIYVSGVKEGTIAFTDEEVEVERTVEETKKPEAPKTRAQARRELAEISQGKKLGIIARIDIGVGQMVNKFFAAEREPIGMIIRNVLPLMAFASTILGIIQVSSLGNIIANTISPLRSTMSGMIMISLICDLPFLSPILGPGAVITRVVGILPGAEIGLRSIPARYALPALLAISAQAGGDFVPAGLSLGETGPETTEFGVPAVLYSRVITEPLVVIIAFVFSIDMY